MTAPQFLTEDVAGERIRLTGEEARHAARVARIRPGEWIRLADGKGTVAEARVLAVEAGPEVVAEVVDRQYVPPPRPRIVVWQALPKGGRLDEVARKLTEVGASGLVLFEGQRSVVRWDAAATARRIGHLRGVAREAVKQARSAWILEVCEPRPLGEIHLPALVFHEHESRRLRAALPAEPPEDLALVIGPEGGLTPEEVEGLAKRGAEPVGLGPLLLRTETAPVVAAALVLHAYGVLG